MWRDAALRICEVVRRVCLLHAYTCLGMSRGRQRVLFMYFGLCVSLSVVLLLLMIDRLVLPYRITVKFVVHGFRWNFDDYLDGLTREAPCWSISGMFARICLQSRNALVDRSVACQLFVSLTTLHRAGRSWSALFPGILLADCQSSLRSLSTSARSVTLHSTKRFHISTLGV